MNRSSHDATLAPTDPWRIYAGLAWNDWRRHRLGIVLGLPVTVVAMFATGAVTPADAGPFLFFGLVMGLACGLGFGRSEWSLGEEELAFALPPTRRARYLVRLAIGLATIGAMVVLALLPSASPFARELAASFAGAEPPALDVLPWEGPATVLLIVAAPLALYLETFAVSMPARGARDLRWLAELILFALGALALLWGGRAWLGAQAGWLVAPLLLLVAGLRARAGLRAYERKEAVLDARAGPESSTALAVTITLILLGLALFGVAVLLYRQSAAG